MIYKYLYLYDSTLSYKMDCYTLANIFSYCEFDTKLILQRVLKQFMYIQYFTIIVL